MPSFFEELVADRERHLRALRGLVEEQMAVVERLDSEFETASNRLDRAVLLIEVFTEQFGRGAVETNLANREAEDANTAVYELTNRLRDQRAVLEHLEQRLAAAESGEVPTAPDGEAA